MSETPAAKSTCGHDHAHGQSCGHDHGHDHDHDHGHGDGHGDGCGHDHGHGAGAVAEREWTRRFLLFLELVVLLIWAGTMGWFYASGRINHYLIGEGTFRIQVLVGGVLLTVMGLFNWQMRHVAGDCGHDHGAHGHGDGVEGDCGHDHDHEGTAGGRGLALALLAVVVVAAAVGTPDDFSDKYKKNMLNAYASRAGGDTETPEAFRLTPQKGGEGEAAGGMTLAVVEKYQPRNAAGNFELGVQELYYSSADPEYAKVMRGQGVETVGQVVKDSSGEAGRWRVFVLQMTCCAADARPISLPVVFEGVVPSLQEMGWFKLTGKIDYVEERGIPVAILRASGAQPSLRPKEQRSLF